MPYRQNTSISIGTYSTQADYRLPSTIKALQDGWLTTFQSSAVVAALFAVVESQLLSFVKNAIQSNIGPDSRSGQALLIFTYLALFLSLSAAMSSVLLTDEMGSVPLRASRGAAAGRHSLTLELYDECTTRLLSRFNGGRRSWQLVMWHWMFTLVIGYVCLVVQLVLYAWCTETGGIKGGVLCIAIVTTLPLLDLLPRATRKEDNSTPIGMTVPQTEQTQRMKSEH